MGGFPLAHRWHLDGLVINGDPAVNGGWELAVDPDGVAGWSGSPAPRTSRYPRIGAHGAYRGPGWRSERIVSMTGWGWAPNPQSRLALEQRLAAWLSDPYRLYPLRREDLQSGENLTLYVELDDQVLVTPVDAQHVRWSIQVAAPDPVKYGSEQSASTALPTRGTGLNWQPGLDWEPGLDWGEPTSRGAVTVSNPGTADVWPRFRIDGPVISPEIIVDGRYRLRYAGVVDWGEWLEIDSHPARRSVILNGSVPRRLDRAEWRPIPAGGSTDIAFSAASLGNPEALLTVYWSPGYW